MNNIGFIKKGSETEYRFVSKRSNIYSNGDNKLVSVVYYQLSIYKNPKNNKYHIRRFSINENNQFVSVKEKYLTETEYIKFKTIQPKHKYSLHPDVDLNVVPYPSNCDVSLARSVLLS